MIEPKTPIELDPDTAAALNAVLTAAIAVAHVVKAALSPSMVAQVGNALEMGDVIAVTVTIPHGAVGVRVVGAASSHWPAEQRSLWESVPDQSLAQLVRQ